MELGSKECIEDLIQLFWGQPYPGITDRDQQLTVLRLRSDRKIPPGVHVLHGVDSIKHKVHENLLQLHRVSHNPWKICRQFSPDRYGVTRCLAAQEDDYLSNDFVHINRLMLWRTLPEEQADPADDFGGTGCVFSHSRRSLTRLVQIGIVARKPAQAGIGVSDGGGNRLIYFVRKGCGQLSHGCHAADVCEIRLRLAQRVFGMLALGDVRRAAHELRQIPEASKTGWPTVCMCLTVPSGRRIRNSTS